MKLTMRKGRHFVPLYVKHGYKSLVTLMHDSDVWWGAKPQTGSYTSFKYDVNRKCVDFNSDHAYKI